MILYTAIAVFILNVSARSVAGNARNDSITELYPIFKSTMMERLNFHAPFAGKSGKSIDDEFEHEIRTIEVHLNQMVELMSGFIVDERFNYVAFEPNVRKFRIYISDIDYAIETKLGYNRDVEKRAILCRKVFQIMVDSMEKMKRYAGGNAEGKIAMLNIIELRVWAALLTLNHNFRGTLDGYPKEVLRLHCMISIIKRSLWRETNVPPGMLSSFESLAARVDAILKPSMKAAGYESHNRRLCFDVKPKIYYEEAGMRRGKAGE